MSRASLWMLTGWVLLVGCRKQVEPAPVRPQIASARTRWTPVAPPDRMTALEAPGRVLAGRGSQAVVSPPLAARVERIEVEPGQRVARGQVLAYVVMPEIAAAGAALSSGRARVAALESRRQQLEILRKEGLALAAETSQLDVALAEARGQREQALAVLRGAGVDPGRAAGGRVPLRSPVEGLVVRVDGVVGELRAPGAPPLFAIAQAAGRRIEARFSQMPPPGVRFEFMPSAGAAVPIELVSFAPAMDESDRSHPAWFEIPPAVSLPPGTLGRVVARVTEPQGVATVPAAAVGRRGDQVVVRRRRGGEVTVLPVEVLVTSGADALVRGDLAPQDEVAAPFGFDQEGDSP